METKTIVKIVVASVIFLVGIAVFALVNPLVIIGAGQRGVVLEWGAVSNRVLDEGIHWVTPIKDNVQKLDIKVQKEGRKVSAASKDLQIVTSKVAVNYHLDEGKVNKLWQEIGEHFRMRVISPSIEEYVKKTTAKYTAEELVTKREEVKEDLKASLRESLLKSHIVLDDVFITDFQFSQQFDKAIEAKVTAEQRALEAKNDLERVKMEAEQQITRAKADAEAIRIQAEAITQQGGKDYVQLKAVEKWNGSLPSQMIPGSAVPFINL